MYTTEGLDGARALAWGAFRSLQSGVREEVISIPRWSHIAAYSGDYGVQRGVLWCARRLDRDNFVGRTPSRTGSELCVFHFQSRLFQVDYRGCL